MPQSSPEATDTAPAARTPAPPKPRASYRLQSRERLSFELGIIALLAFVSLLSVAIVTVSTTNTTVMRFVWIAILAIQGVFAILYVKYLLVDYGMPRVTGDLLSAFGRYAVRMPCSHCAQASTYDASTLHIRCNACGSRGRERVRTPTDGSVMRKTWESWARACVRCRKPVERPATISLYCAKCHRYSEIPQPFEIPL